MEEIHNTYRHFGWYPDFIIEYVRSNPLFIPAHSLIVDTFKWADTRKGWDYWLSIVRVLEELNLTLSSEQATIFNREAKNFYTSLYEGLKLANPELFI